MKPNRIAFSEHALLARELEDMRAKLASISFWLDNQYSSESRVPRMALAAMRGLHTLIETLAGQCATDCPAQVENLQAAFSVYSPAAQPQETAQVLAITKTEGLPPAWIAVIAAQLRAKAGK